MNYNNKIKELTQVIEKSNNIVIFPHHNPDGDAIGAALGLNLLLKNMGKNSQVISPSKYPKFLHWLPGNEKVLIYPYKKNTIIKAIENADVIFYVDFNSLKRFESFENIYTKIEKKAKIVLIDHHPNPEKITDINFSDTSVSSTSELIFKVILDSNFISFVDKNIAESLFTGIVTDTGLLNYNSSNSQTFEIVSKLLSYNIDKQKVIDNIYNNFSEKRMRLMGYCLNDKMQVFSKFNSALITLTKEDLIKYEFQSGDTEGFVNMPLSIQNINFSAFFIEKEGYIKASFRSKGNFPANKFAKKYFNGGGHLNAAGGKCLLSLEQTIIKFNESIKEFYKNDF